MNEEKKDWQFEQVGEVESKNEIWMLCPFCGAWQLSPEWSKKPDSTFIQAVCKLCGNGPVPWCTIIVPNGVEPPKWLVDRVVEEASEIWMDVRKYRGD